MIYSLLRHTPIAGRILEVRPPNYGYPLIIFTLVGTCGCERSPCPVGRNHPQALDAAGVGVGLRGPLTAGPMEACRAHVWAMPSPGVARFETHTACSLSHPRPRGGVKWAGASRFRRQSVTLVFVFLFRAALTQPRLVLARKARREYE